MTEADNGYSPIGGLPGMIAIQDFAGTSYWLVEGRDPQHPDQASIVGITGQSFDEKGIAVQNVAGRRDTISTQLAKTLRWAPPQAPEQNQG